MTKIKEEYITLHYFILFSLYNSVGPEFATPATPSMISMAYDRPFSLKRRELNDINDLQLHSLATLLHQF